MAIRPGWAPRLAALEYELEQNVDGPRVMIVDQTLRALYQALLTQYRELARIRSDQITSLQKTLRGQGATEGRDASTIFFSPVKLPPWQA